MSKMGSKQMRQNRSDIFYHAQQLLNIFCSITLVEKLISWGQRSGCWPGSCRPDPGLILANWIWGQWFSSTHYRCLSCQGGLLSGGFRPYWGQLRPPVWKNPPWWWAIQLLTLWQEIQALWWYETTLRQYMFNTAICLLFYLLHFGDIEKTWL